MENLEQAEVITAEMPEGNNVPRVAAVVVAESAQIVPELEQVEVAPR